MDDQDLLPLDPAYRTVIRLSAALAMLVPLGAALIAEVAVPGLTGLFLIPALLLAVWLIGIAPSRRFSRWRYALGGDLLRIVHGYLFRQDTVVPLGRVQHIDVHQGPLMRRWDLATLTVHTAGNHGASVSLPGLRHADALALRETIRAHIKAAQN
jgi:membrane protein YdbS with pleckstrin-like domain